MKGWRLFLGLVIFMMLAMIGLLLASISFGSIRRSHDISYVANAPTSSGFSTDQLHLLDLETGVRIRMGLFSNGVWSPDGKSFDFLFSSDQDNGLRLMGALRFSTRFVDIRGMVSYFAWSPDGRSLGFLLKESGGVNGLYIYDPQTEEVRKLTGDKNVFAISFVWSPDSQKIAYVASKFDVWVVTLAGDLRQLPIKLASADSPLLWSLDSASLIVKAKDDTTSRTRINIADDTRTSIPVCDAGLDPKHQSQLAWHPNGTLTCTRRNPDTRITDIVMVNPETGDFTVLASEKAVIGNLSWSPDGRYLLYQADATILAFNVMAYDEAAQSLSQVWRVEGQSAQWRVRR